MHCLEPLWFEPRSAQPLDQGHQLPSGIHETDPSTRPHQEPSCHHKVQQLPTSSQRPRRLFRHPSPPRRHIRRIANH
jgi:hypothetical protein